MPAAASSSQFFGQQAGLIVAALPQPPGVERHPDHDVYVRMQPLPDAMVGVEHRAENRFERTKVAVLERMDRVADWPSKLEECDQ